MVWTFKVDDDGALSFTDGLIDMVGVQNAEDAEEVLQRTRIRFLLQYGVKAWHPYDGFDFDGINDHAGSIAEIGYDLEKLIELHVLETLAQDAAIDPEVERLEVEQGENRDYTIRVTFRTIFGNRNELEFGIGG